MDHIRPTDPITTSSGLQIDRYYWSEVNMKPGDKVFRERVVKIPETHYLRKTFGLEQMETTKNGTWRQYKFLGTIFDNKKYDATFRNIADARKYLQDLKQLKNIKNLPFLEEIINIARHIK